MLNILKKLGWFLGKLALLFVGLALLITVFYWITKTLGSGERININLVKQQVEIILEESEESYLTRVGNLLYTKHDKNYKLVDHKIKFDRKQGSVLLTVDDKSLEFKYPYSLMVTTHLRNDELKVEDFYFNIALTPQGRIKNSEARSRIYNILKDLRDVGWKRYISSASSRISGEEVYVYNQEPNIYDQVSLDDNHILNDEEWMSLTSYYWEFYYKDKAYLNLRIQREQKGKKINLDESYFLTIDVKTIVEAEKSNFKPHERFRWQELYPALLKHTKGLREKKENQAIKAGYNIDYHYQDSPLNRGIFDLSKEPAESEQVTPIKSGY